MTSMKSQHDRWRVWDLCPDYGDLLYRRAIGDLPEMESSKAVARLVRSWVRGGDSILDVGCGAGHYLRSLLREISAPFSYTGVDATAHYIDLARKAWKEQENARFEIADIYALPFDDAEYDVVISCNLLLHLPSIKIPLQEIVRVSRRNALIRTLVGDRSFRIQEVRNPSRDEGLGDEDEFDEKGEPKNFNYYNIYARSYIEKLLSRMPSVMSYRIIPDRDYDVAQLSADLSQEAVDNTTRLVDGWQVNDYILQPWHFILINVTDKL